MWKPSVAYFSMEIAVDERLPTYAGGLGVLAGDTILSAADEEIPLVAVTLVHREGYFDQTLDDSGWQSESPVRWSVESELQEVTPLVTMFIGGRSVTIRAWRSDVVGNSGFVIPVYFLDTDLPENDPRDRQLTSKLYGGDERNRLCQEAVLGIGGVRLLRALGFSELQRFHLNEGHAALLTLELLEERRRARGCNEIQPDEIAEVRRQCVFTTHTPVTAGHDRFPLELARDILGDRPEFRHQQVFCCDSKLNLTFVALNMSHYVNGVAKRHRDVSQEMFANYKIDSITNGVHLGRWASSAMSQLFDIHVSGWRDDNFSLRSIMGVPVSEIQEAHREAKLKLLVYLQKRNTTTFDPHVFTIGFARRSTAYKRMDLILSDPDRLQHIAATCGGLQFVFSGKAHPRDHEGKMLIQKVIKFARQMPVSVKIVYVANYDIGIAKLVTAGVDLWLNTPQPPLEASGTSGMKAALNGVPSLSVLDGWWVEGCIEGVTGWAIGNDNPANRQDLSHRHASQMFDKLEHQILPLYQNSPQQYAEIMRSTIALNASFFNTQRMIQQYALKAYLQ